MKKLGELLLERGWVDRSDLLRALRQQQRLGGRLGTCLLEMGAVSEEELLHVLGVQHSVDPVTVEEVRQVPEDVQQLLSAKFAVRCQAVPVKATASKVHVAMRDPHDLAKQDELAFAVGRRLVLRAITEVRLAEALERYYGEEMPRRVAKVMDHLNRHRFLWRDEESAAVGATSGSPTAHRRGAVAELFPTGPSLTPPRLPILPGAKRAGAAEPATPTPTPVPAAAPSPILSPATESAPSPPPEPATETSDTEPVATEPSSAAPAPARPSAVPLSEQERAALYGGRAPAPVSYDEALERRGKISDREQVATLVLDFLRQEFERVILFSVHHGEVHGWAADGDSLDTAAVKKLTVPLDQPSLFLNLQQGSRFHLGPLPSLPAHRPLVAQLGGESPDECLVLPVSLGGRMVVALYADRHGQPLGGIDLEALRRFADAVADALERCILLKRQAQT